MSQYIVACADHNSPVARAFGPMLELDAANVAHYVRSQAALLHRDIEVAVVPCVEPGRGPVASFLGECQEVIRIPGQKKPAKQAELFPENRYQS